MLLQFFILFNFGLYLSAFVPSLIFSSRGVPYPQEPIPFINFLKENVYYFVDCLPIVALQYLISLQYKNFLVPMGIGFLLWIGAIGAVSWKYGFVVPYTYSMFNYLKDQTGGRAIIPMVNIHAWAIGYFVIITAVSCILYITKKEKG